MSATDRRTASTDDRGESAPRGGRESPRGSRAALFVVLGGVAGFLLVLGLSAWIGVRFALGGAPDLRFVVEGGGSSVVRVLSVLLEGPSGAVLVGVVTGLAAAAGITAASPAGESRSGPGGVRAALARRWRELEELSADAARWIGGVVRRHGGWHAAVLAAVVAAGAAVRLLYLSQPVRYDEAFTFTHFASRPAELGLSRYTYPNNHLLHTLLVHLVTSVFGSSPAAMRLPAFLAGAATVPAAYAAWDALGDADEALVAAALTAVASPLVLYSTNARGYAIVVLCSLLMVPLAARLLRRRDLAAWALLCATAAAALHAMPVALYPYGAILAWMVLSGAPGGDPDGSGAPGGGSAGPRREEGAARSGVRPRRTLLREAAVATLAVGIAVAWLYMPAVQRSGVAAVVANRFVTPSPIGEFVRALPGFFADVWESWTAGWPGPVAAAVGLLGAAGAAREVRDGVRDRAGGGDGAAGASAGRLGVSFPLVALGWSVLVLLVNRRVPFARVWLFLLPVFGLLVARGAGWIAARVRSAAGGDATGRWARLAGPATAALLLAGLGGSVVAADAVVESEATGPYHDGEAAAHALAERMESGDTVLALGPAEVVLEYWFQHLGLSPGRINSAPDPGGRLFVVVDRSQGQTLADLMARAGVSGSRRTRTREVTSFGRSSLHVLLPGG